MAGIPVDQPVPGLLPHDFRAIFKPIRIFLNRECPCGFGVIISLSDFNAGCTMRAATKVRTKTVLDTQILTPAPLPNHK
jgi:hypothetical protein